MVAVAVLVALVIVFAYPPLGPLAIVSTVNLWLWRRRRAMLRAERARARARAEERRRRELILAMKSLP